ncbi:MAG: hypothetical protein JNK04_25215 [Myxococcales bacterium]|nr:hypothetical protein [Myxococcales bacterium]
MSIFVEDRELLTCPACGLAEDVAIDGRLFTFRMPDVGEETGLRFGTSNECGLFRCPFCDAEVAEPVADVAAAST